MNSVNKISPELLQRFSTDFPDIIFKKSKSSWWDPNTKTVHYNPDSTYSVWSIFHEVGHAIHSHDHYTFDLELVKMEREAWDTAHKLARDYGIEIDSDHIEDCLDTYRDWLHGRSVCPACSQNGMQLTESTYRCMNCSQEWRVSPSRFCRKYRRKIKTR